MKFNKLFLATALFACASTSVSAQVYRRGQRMAQYTVYADSIIREFKNSLSQYNLSNINDTADVAITPYLYRISDPSTYYSQSLKNEFNIGWESQNDASPLLASSTGMMYRSNLNQLIDKALVGAYMSHPQNFQHYDAQFDNVEVLTETKIENKKAEVDAILNAAPVLDDVTTVIDDATVELQAEKPNFWKKSGKFTTQFTQSYFSDNWYKGGSNNVTLLSTLLLEANYNDQKKIQWDNKADFRLGFVSTPDDDTRSFMTNSDKIYLASKLGVKAAKAWYYTVQAEVNSQFLPGYRKGKLDTFSRFLSPLDVFVSVGMDFKPTLKKGSFSAVLFPLSYKMRYIGDKESDIFQDDGVTHKYPIHESFAMMKDGAPITTKHDFGSKVELNAKFELVKNLTWRSRFYYYTTYKYVESEWENALSFQFNKYLSTEVNALWRFDDNRKRDPEWKLKYFQFKEYFTFGLSYNF